MISIGRITKTVGIKGQVQVEVFSGRGDRLKDLSSVFVGISESDATRSTVEATELRRNGVVVKLNHINGRGEAEALRGYLLFVEDDRQVELEKGTFFVHQVIGLRAIGEDGQELGTITDVMDLPGGDIWVLRREGKDVMIPAVKEFIRKVDVAAGTVLLHTIEGLLEGSEG